jgi:hypothetical protein
LCSFTIVREGFFRFIGTVTDMLYTKTFCVRDGSHDWRVLPPIPPRLDGPWFTIREERDWQENDAEAVKCSCNISSSAVIPSMGIHNKNIW